MIWQHTHTEASINNLLLDSVCPSPAWMEEPPPPASLPSETTIDCVAAMEVSASRSEVVSCEEPSSKLSLVLFFSLRECVCVGGGGDMQLKEPEIAEVSSYHRNPSAPSSPGLPRQQRLSSELSASHPVAPTSTWWRAPAPAGAPGPSLHPGMKRQNLQIKKPRRPRGGGAEALQPPASRWPNTPPSACCVSLSCF